MKILPTTQACPAMGFSKILLKFLSTNSMEGQTRTEDAELNYIAYSTHKFGFRLMIRTGNHAI
jgi:hypothetical protein